MFIAEGKGGHQRLVPMSTSFFSTVAAYMDLERPAGIDTDRVFVVLKGPRRGRPLSVGGLDEIVTGAPASGRPRAWDVSRVASHVLHAFARTRHVDRSVAGASRAPIDRVDTVVSASWC